MYKEYTAIADEKPSYCIITDKPFPKGMLDEENGNELHMYQHQHECVEKIRNGKHVILSCSTGSGKTEAAVTAILDNYQFTEKQPMQCIFLYPTKVLSKQQRDRLKKYFKPLHVCSYDGDNNKRLKQVKHSEILISNPHMMLEIIKHKTKMFEEYAPNLRYIVIDEIHMYNCYQLSLLSYIVRELKEKAKSELQFIVLSATLGSQDSDTLKGPDLLKKTFSERLDINPEKISVIKIGDNGENQTKRERIQLKKKRKCIVTDDAKSLKDIIIQSHEEFHNDTGRKAGITTVVFTNSIRECEMLYNEVREMCEIDNPIVLRHHSGIPKEERENIEDVLIRDNEHDKIVFSVKTLAQGIDVKDIMQVIHVGVPMRHMDFVQREGRMGRVNKKNNAECEYDYCRSILILQDDDSHHLDRRYLSLINKNKSVDEVYDELKKIETIRIPLHPPIDEFFGDYSALFYEPKLELDKYLAEYGSPLKFLYTELGSLFESYLKFYGHGPTMNIILKEDEYHSEYLGYISQYEAYEKMLPGMYFSHKSGNGRYLTYKVTGFFEAQLKRDPDEKEKYFKPNMGTIFAVQADIQEGKEVESHAIWNEIKFIPTEESTEQKLFGKLILTASEFWKITKDKDSLKETRVKINFSPKTKIIPTCCIKLENIDLSERQSHLLCHSILHAIWDVEGLALDEIMHKVKINDDKANIFLYESEPSGILAELDWEKVFKKAEEYLSLDYTELEVPFCYYQQESQDVQITKEELKKFKKEFEKRIPFSHPD